MNNSTLDVSTDNAFILWQILHINNLKIDIGTMLRYLIVPYLFIASALAAVTLDKELRVVIVSGQGSELETFTYTIDSPKSITLRGSYSLKVRVGHVQMCWMSLTRSRVPLLTMMDPFHNAGSIQCFRCIHSTRPGKYYCITPG